MESFLLRVKEVLFQYKYNVFVKIADKRQKIIFGKRSKVTKHWPMQCQNEGMQQ